MDEKEKVSKVSETTKKIKDTYTEHKKAESVKSKVIWSIVFVIIAALTVSTIMAQGDFSFSEFVKFLKELDPFWLTLAFVSMIGYIFFEAAAIITIAKSFGYKRSMAHGCIYAAGDIYFSAITPSATGGQPASAYFMIKDGFRGSVVTVTLVVNLIMYTFGIIILGIVAFIMDPSVFLGFSFVSKCFIVLGSFMLCAVAFCFVFILVKSSMLHSLGNWGLNLLAKLKLIRNVERKKEKLADAINSYADKVSQIGGKRMVLVRALILNVLQRACSIAVTLFVFLADGGQMTSGISVWASQCMVVLGSNPIPIPGAMGISDYLLIDAFGAMGFDGSMAMNLNLVSRAISFYSCVIICGALMIIRMISYKIIDRRKSTKK